MRGKITDKKERRRKHAKGCNRRLLMKWSGMACRCGARWVCA